jgi:hypothetical protein
MGSILLVQGGSLLLGQMAQFYFAIVIMGASNPSTKQGGFSAENKIRVENSFIQNSGATEKGGVFYNSSVEIENTIISASTVYSTGSGGVFSNSNVTMNNSTISGSTAGQSGAIAWLGSVFAINSVFYNNSDASISGGAIFANTITTLINSLLYGNNTNGAIFVNNNNKLVNSTIAKNNSAVFDKSSVGSFMAINSIIDGVFAKNSEMDSSMITFLNSTFTSMNIVITQSNTINGFDNNQFMNYANNDFRLVSSSVAVNSGSNQLWMINSYNITTDITGMPRIFFMDIDLGAYESLMIAIPSGSVFSPTEDFVSSHIDTFTNTTINLKIPSGSLLVPVFIEIETYPTVHFKDDFNVSLDRQTGLDVVSYNFLQAVKITVNNALDGNNVSINTYLEITMGFNPTINNTENVRVYYYDPNSKSWKDDGISIIKVYNDRVIFRVTHLTYFSAVKLAVNNLPVFDTIGNLSISENENIVITLNGSDPDGDSISYGVIGLPSTATFNSTTGFFAWTPNLIESGQYYITFNVVDIHGASQNQLVIIDVLDINGLDISSWTIKSNSSNYILIGLPIGTITKDIDFISWKHDMAWSGEYELISKNSIDNGMGIWAKISEDIFIDLSTANFTPGLKSVSLHLGWNLISNPQVNTISIHDIAISYQGQNYTVTSAIQNNLIYNVLYKYTGNDYLNSSDFEPFTGYWIVARKPVDILFPWKDENINIDVQSNTLEGAINLELKVSIIEDNNQNREVFLLAGDMDTRFVNQLSAPMLFNQKTQISIQSEGQQLHTAQTVYDNTKMSWDLIIQKETEGNIRLNIKELTNLNNNDYVYIIEDRNTGTKYNMNSEEDILINATQGINNYMVYAFSSSVKTSQLSYINFPNPFNPLVETTRIQYEFSDVISGIDMNVKIFTRHGREIRNLNNIGGNSLGFVDWDGKDEWGNNMPTDVCFYIMELKDNVGKIQKRGKIVIW